MSGWTGAIDGELIHVTPNGDLVVHELDEDCVCGPRVDPVERADGSIGWIHTHHSLDGRESREQA